MAVIAVAAGIFVLLHQERTGRPVGRPQVALGRPAPDFTLPNLSGEVVHLSDYRGRVVFLNIWASWCNPCRTEMPSMEKLYQTLKGEDFEILAVSIDASGAKAVAPFAKEFKLTFPILLDVKGSVADLYGTTGVPETFIIDKNGIIVHKAIGPREWADPAFVDPLRNLARKPADRNDVEENDVKETDRK